VAEIDRLRDLEPTAGSEPDECLEPLSAPGTGPRRPPSSPPGPDYASASCVDFMLEHEGLSRAEIAVWMGGRAETGAFFPPGPTWVS